ncbi:5'/3'-nucleotidase SurE [Candidatus Halobonum tyrrellensis]|uniref:5'-nucleotidase SurE n=1 Tax=Candidatus Halobonum tyrrellensis G22 TaxID=1324957 RepID=V4HJG4_9EURY|nr:5'/3'-nucleotidase SurE [Candidatus Halobonum tyrrellensis]ESP88059.1 acid phosphatase SurE [Candidatus Halobonum tyrrellensis G22]
MGTSARGEPRYLLTNDDGIDSPGFRALYDALSDVGEVVAVAPADDRSAVGRTLSTEVNVREHELGYAVEGTPADCAVAGLESLCPDADMVVAGCNKGANIGAYVLGRSGTVSAAVEAAFFDVPAMAVSLYVPAGSDTDWRELATEEADYRGAVTAARYLADRTLDAGVFERTDYLNVNAPWADAEGMEITRPSTVYDMTAERDGDSVVLHDRTWDRMVDGSLPDPEGTDRRAVAEGRVSVSPLTAPHTTRHHEALDGLATEYDRAVGEERERGSKPGE